MTGLFHFDRTKAVLSRLASVLFENPQKLETFKKLRDRCVALTSDDGISVTLEIYRDPDFHLGEYYRFVVDGTRSSFSVTFDTTNKVFRKPANSKPFKHETFYNRNCYEVLDFIQNF